MASRKHSRSGPEENRIECPFTISYPPSTRANQGQKGKKRKRDGHENEKKGQFQMSPFSPTGKFKNNSTMDLHYTVEPRKRWMKMTRYNSFVLNGTKYYSEGFVFVANESTIEQHKAAHGEPSAGLAKKSDSDWVARILEIRASDEHHVYARIYWMYSPDELPPGTTDGKKSVQGRQPYHGQNELIASNHMDIINVISVTQPAKVNQWIETDDEEIQPALYWRQAYDLRTGQLSSVETICKCETPANPDKMLLECSNPECGRWMHQECLDNDVVMRVYEKLGTDKPHLDRQAADKTDKTGKAETGKAETGKAEERTTRLLSPTDTCEKETQPTIDVRSSEVQENGLVKKSEEGTPQPEKAGISIQQTPTVDVSKPFVSKRNRKKMAADAKPYDGLFEAKLILDEGSTFWKVRDLRTNVTDGSEKWTEKAHCLFCDVVID